MEIRNIVFAIGYIISTLLAIGIPLALTLAVYLGIPLIICITVYLIIKHFN